MAIQINLKRVSVSARVSGVENFILDVFAEIFYWDTVVQQLPVEVQLWNTRSSSVTEMS